MTAEESSMYGASGPRHGDHIGPYRLLRVLGEGGMGIVFESEQRTPMRRRVAIKVMRPGLDTGEVIARFEAERQALALMEHPAIAKVLDAGETEDGRPYFVMELVQGEPLREYADARRLSVRDRLILFIRICHAVQHAHLKGVIHRDLKPSNILVVERDGIPEPKVIDFGIAKATAQRLTDLTLVTGFGCALGTPAYMSPEQADASGLDVDTRADVYSLGVTLYELLVGRLPVDPADVGPQRFMYQLLMKESDPPTPSTKYRTLSGECRAAVATFRHTDPSGLLAALSSDLDAIVMKAMEKDRDRRYDTATALALDIQRHLRHEPVLAGSPSLALRVRKFVRRHRVGVTAGATCAVALAAGSVLATVGMVRARNAERGAEAEARATREVSAFLMGLFKVADPGVARGNTITAREILDKGSERIRSELAGQPITQARLMHSMGNVYRSLGLYDEATTLLEQALALRTQILEPGSLDLAESFRDLAQVEHYRGRYARADTLYRRALTIQERDPDRHRVQVASTLSDLGALSWQRGQYDEAEALFQRALANYQAAPDRDDAEMATTLNNLASVLTSRGAFEEAGALLRRALAIHRQLRGADHPEVATALGNLAMVAWKQGKYADADSLAQQALAIREQVLPADHPDVAYSLHVLANIRADQGRYADAESLYQRSRAILETAYGPMHADVAKSLRGLGMLYETQAKHAQAATQLRRALEIEERVYGHDDPTLVTTLDELVAVLRQAGRSAEADVFDARARNIRSATGPGQRKG